MARKYWTYTVNGIAEETECNDCGAPILTNDEVFTSDDEARVYCSESCADSGEREQESRAA